MPTKIERREYVAMLVESGNKEAEETVLAHFVTYRQATAVEVAHFLAESWHKDTKLGKRSPATKFDVLLRDDYYNKKNSAYEEDSSRWRLVHRKTIDFSQV